MVKRKRLIVIMMVIVLLVTAWAFAAGSEKIAVAADDKIPSAAVSKQAGLAPFFLFFDEKGKMTEAMENPFKDKEGAGKSVAEWLMNKGATVVVAEGFGGPIVEVMKGKGIKAVAFKGSAEEAVKRVLRPK
jgi:predicted Fe-Mo cluster-binding NifX family protein